MKAYHLLLFFSIVCLNTHGQAFVFNKLWDARFGGNSYEGTQSIIGATDGSILISGIASSGISGNKTENSRGGGGDYWVVKLNA